MPPPAVDYQINHPISYQIPNLLNSQLQVSVCLW